ncbi:hypothetical protein R3P38DRAFT_977163 [Favolaschia claudopus]|uniref:Uncharacterized protein n=1 Tax=Favolaschia claudopus TaxID=2862362 RepID=A0AAW0E4R8_9AGAR
MDCPSEITYSDAKLAGDARPGSGVIDCEYTDGTQCQYSSADGSLITGPQSFGSCPLDAVSTPPSTESSQEPPTSSNSPPASFKQSFAGSTSLPIIPTNPHDDSSISSPQRITSHHPLASGTTNPQPQTPSSTYPQPSITDGMNNSSNPIIISPAQKGRGLTSVTTAGIAIAAGIVIGFGGLVWYIRRVKRRRNSGRRESGRHPRAHTISPFTLLTSNQSNQQRSDLATHSIGGSTLARRVLQTELQAATEKFAELQEQERRSEARPHFTGRRLWRLASARWGSQSDLELDLRAAREEISMLVARMNVLEANSEFAGENARIEGPPPDYMPPAS